MSGKRRAGESTPAKGAKTTRKGKTKQPRAWWKRVLLWGTTTMLVLMLVAVGGFVFLYQSTDIPDPNSEFQTQTSFIYYDDGASQIGSFATQNRESISYDEMPQVLRDAVIAAEDRTFWTNQGIEPRGILRAAFSNAQGNATQGASTITQQYVKILYLTQDRTLSRKVKEAILSLKIRRQLSKEQILEGYLNTIYFGRGAYGVQAASKAYFDVDAADLDVRQAAVLASVLNNPTNLDPANGEAARSDLEGRYSYVLNGMAEMGTLAADRAERAVARLPEFPEIKRTSAYGGQRGHMLKLVRDELRQLGFDDAEIDGGGLKVTTTLSRKAMSAAQKGALEQRPEGFSTNQLHTAVAMVDPRNGALRGFFGGQDYLSSEINWAASLVQPGSTFKAFAVAAGIKDGFALTDTFTGNSPLTLETGEEVENQGNQSYGQVSLLTATENSINTAFIQMTEDMEDGPQKIQRVARSFGMPGNDEADFGIPNYSRGLDSNIGVSLGSGDVSPINMAAAYATIANEGVQNDVHVIAKVEDRFGEVQYQREADPERAIDADIANDTSYALQQVVSSGSGTAALALGRPAAGKTGTATNADGDVSSSWFVGYTPQLVTAVAYTRGTGREKLDDWLPEYFGGSFPARTWTDVMTRALDGAEVLDFPEPAFVDGDAPEPDREFVPAPPPPPQTSAPAETPSETVTEEPETDTTEPDRPTREPSAPPSTTRPPQPTEPPATTQPPPSPEPTSPPSGEGGDQSGRGREE